MTRWMGIAVALGLVASPALAQRVTLDYADGFDFKSTRTTRKLPHLRP